MMHIEHKFDMNGDDTSMTASGFFFVLVGVASLTAQLFRVIDAIERPVQRRRSRAAAR